MQAPKGTILGVDLGTSSLKVVLFSDALHMLHVEKRHYAAKGETLTASGWWRAFLAALRAIGGLYPLRDVRAVSLSGYNAMVGTDAAFTPTTPVVLYTNSGPVRHLRGIMDEADAAYIYERTGNRLFAAGTMGPILRWLKDTRQGYDASAHFMYSNGFIAARLTGRPSVDAVRASVSLLHNPRGEALVWEAGLPAFFGIDGAKLPPIVAPWEAVGGITAKAAAETGLRAGIPVLAGAMDSMCAALGSGLVTAGRVLDIGGSAGGLASVMDTPLPNPQTYLVRYTVPGLWCNIFPLGAGARLFPWFIEHFAPGWTMDDFFREAAGVPPFCGGVQFLPYVGNTRHPYWRADATGHFLGLGESSTLPCLARAVMEGLACAHRRILDDMAALGVCPEVITASGGDSLSAGWTGIKANFTATDYVVSAIAERSALGCAILAAHHLGLLADFGNAISNIFPHETTIYFERDTASMVQYNQNYRLFLENCAKLYNE